MDRRFEPRFQVNSPGKVTELSNPEREFDCVLVDISATGMKLVSNESFSVDSQLLVEFASHLVLANVRHSQPRGSKFIVGVERVHALPKLALPLSATRSEKIQALIDDFHRRFDLGDLALDVSERIALAVSGVGFRSTLFHIGSFWRMNEIGYLPKLDCMSSVSGGSILAGLLGINWDQLEFDATGKAANFEPLIVAPLRTLCAKNVEIVAVGEAVFAPWKESSDLVECEYRKHLFGDATLQQLPDRPQFVFSATNVGTGASFRFSKLEAGDRCVGVIPNPTFRISLAVTASSTFPPVSPLTVKSGPDLFQRMGETEFCADANNSRELVLSDGALCDGLALDAVGSSFGIILVSDAGGPFIFQQMPETNHPDPIRMTEIAANQSHALHKRALIAEYQRCRRRGAYWGITTPINEYDIGDTLPCPPQVTKELSGLRTRMNSFNDAEQSRLINWGYAICDAALRRWVGVLNQPPAAWPYPAYALDK